MTATEWVVLIAGIAAIAWVNWYFFIAARRRPAAAATDGAAGPQEAVIVVRGGYEPATIRVRGDRPVRLVFDRQETSSCSEDIVIPDFGMRRFLPAFQRTAVEFTPSGQGLTA